MAFNPDDLLRVSTNYTGPPTVRGFPGTHQYDTGGQQTIILFGNTIDVDCPFIFIRGQIVMTVEEAEDMVKEMNDAIRKLKLYQPNVAKSQPSRLKKD